MSELPEDGRLAAVRGCAAEVVGCPPDRIVAVSRFDDGNRHAVYRVTYLDAVGATEDLVVRISYGSDPADCAQAEREARVLDEVGGHAGPLLYDFRLTSPWFDTPTMCMQFIPGRHQELRSATPAEIEHLGSVVAWVHERPVEDLFASGERTGSIASYADGRLRSILHGLTWVRDPFPPPQQDLLKGISDGLRRSLESRKDAGSFSTGEELALLHGDVGPGNVLWGPDPVLIDWEYARLGDPADEIAYLFDQNGLTALQREWFWRAYRDSRGGPLQLGHIVERVTWWEPVTLLGSTLWWLERWVRRREADAAGAIDHAAPREQGYYLDHVIRRLHRLATFAV